MTIANVMDFLQTPGYAWNVTLQKRKGRQQKRKKRKKETLSKERGKVFGEMRKAVISYSDTKEAARMYDALNTLSLREILPCGEWTFGVIEIEEYRKITSDPRQLHCVTYMDKVIDEIFILIFTRMWKLVFYTHSWNDTWSSLNWHPRDSNHGKQFFGVGNKVLESIKMVEKYFCKTVLRYRIGTEKYISCKSWWLNMFLALMNTYVVFMIWFFNHTIEALKGLQFLLSPPDSFCIGHFSREHWKYIASDCDKLLDSPTLCFNCCWHYLIWISSSPKALKHSRL